MASNLPSYIPPDAPDWRKYVEEWRVGNPDLATQFDRLQDPIAKLSATSMDELSDVITTGLERGYSALQIAEGVAEEGYVGVQGTFGRFEDWRSEMIARTEGREAFNAGGLRSYADAQVEEVEAIDGDFDEHCRERNGERFKFDPDTGEIMADASELEEHPNGSLTWGPMGNSNPDFFRQVMAQDAAAEAEAQGIAEEAAGAVVRYAPSNIEGGRAVGDALHAIGKQGSRYIRTDAGYVRQQLPPAQSMIKLLDKTKKMINDVHGDGRLPSLPVEATTKDMKGSGGVFGSAQNGDARYIKIRETTGDNATSYLTHEIGHFLDNSALRTDLDQYGDPLKWATDAVDRGPIKQVFDAIFESNVYKEDARIADELAKVTDVALPRDATGRYIMPPNYGAGPFLKYAMSNRELWARAYAQYIAEVSGDTKSLATIRSDVTMSRVVGQKGANIRYQWTEEEFAPIKAAITQMFIDLGYMVPESA